MVVHRMAVVVYQIKVVVDRMAVVVHHIKVHIKVFVYHTEAGPRQTAIRIEPSPHAPYHCLKWYLSGPPTNQTERERQ